LGQAVGPLVGDLERLIGDLAKHAAGIRAVHCDLANLSDQRVTDGLRLNTGNLLSVTADLRSTSAFVSGAGQSVESSIAAASRDLTGLAAAITEVTTASQDAAKLPMCVEQLNLHVYLAAANLGRSMRQIDEIISFIDKVALPSSVEALGHAVTSARGAAGSERDEGFCEDVNALAVQAEALTRQVQMCARTIVAGACQARAAMATANTLILGFDSAVRAIAGETGTPGIALPGIAQRGAAA
jgi:hypothetical protein